MFTVSFQLHSITGDILEGPSTTIGFPGQTAAFECRVTEGSGAVIWRVNGVNLAPLPLFNGVYPGFTISTDNLRRIIVTDIVVNDNRNGSEFRCFLSDGVISDPAFFYVAGKIKAVFKTAHT